MLTHHHHHPFQVFAPYITAINDGNGVFAKITRSSKT